MLLADEINRAPAKTQAALLEAMEERQVTLDGERHPLPDAVHGVATQNPVEYEGTYPLPEAQLDRFLFKVLVDYAPARGRDRGAAALPPASTPEPSTSCSSSRSATARLGCAAGRPGRRRRDDPGYIARLVRATREPADLLLGGSLRGRDRAAAGSKAAAALEGRGYVLPDDVKGLAGRRCATG